MKQFKSLAALLLCLAAAISFLPVTAVAAGSIDLNHSNSLTVTAVYDQKPISGMQFDAYLISTVDECGELTVIDRYADYAEELDIRGKNDARWQEMSEVLAQEILQDSGLKPSRSAVTDADGVAVFTDLPMGLYLIIGRSVERDGSVYSTAPFFVLVPQQDASSNTWDYDVVANAKIEENPVRDDFQVIKLWEDDCHQDQRPESVTIQLMCDGEPYGDPVTLPYEGDWEYTWHDLEVNHAWTVTETPVEGYAEPKIRLEGNTFVVTNVCDKPTAPSNPTLPQTGQLWWPVPVLVAAGLLLVVLGLIRRRGDTQ